MNLRKMKPSRVVPLVLGLGAIALILLQSRLPAGPRHAAFAFLRPFSDLGGGGEETERLRKENAELLSALLASQVESGRLKEQLRSVASFKEAGLAEAPSVMPARVLLREDASGWHHTIVIDRGTRSGVKAGMVVCEGACVVGRVLEVAESSARVRLATDAAFRMKAAALRQAQGAAGEAGEVTGIFAGSGDGTCRLDSVLDREPVAEGWTVVTVADPARGQPGGLILGEVMKGGQGSDVYGNITVRPRVEVGKLRHVLVVVR